MNERKINIQLEKFLKKENWEFHFSFSEEPEPSWILCFLKVCEESQLKPGLKYFSPNVSKQNYFAAIIGGLNDSEVTLRPQLEKAIRRTNEILNEPIVAEYYSVLRKITDAPDAPDYIKTKLKSQHKELENKLCEMGKYKFVSGSALAAATNWRE